ncbi:MAG TPA: type IV pilus secretin PilQ [Gammaproteobacteria bacterium]|jgi:type IV pilus assembly protein PilQ
MMLFASIALSAQEVTLESVDYSVLASGKTQIRLGFTGPAPQAGSFTIDNPARLAIDLPSTKLGLDRKSVDIDSGIARVMRFAEGRGRTRMVVSLTRMAPYEIRSANNEITISIDGVAIAQAAAGPAAVAAQPRELKEIDFRRGTEGNALLEITLPDPNTVVNVDDKGNRVVVDFLNLVVPEKYVRRLDVNDFATPVTTVDLYNTDAGARMIINATGLYQQLAYQVGATFTLDVRPLTPEEEEESKKDEFGYSGEKLSLNFQNIEVRAVLQLIADFTGLNIVASDTVQGNITLRLKNVPWDQALDIILKTRGLGMRKSGNVVLIAPNDELADREKKELEARQQMVELAPLVNEYYQINYAKAADIANLLKKEQNSILSSRGNVTLDERTNTLMVLDTAEKQEEIAKLIARLDIAVRQVMIESRIVIANDDFSRDLGVRTGVTTVQDNGPDGIYAVTGSAVGTNTMVNSALDNLQSSGSPYPVETPALNDRFNFNLPVGGSAGRIALAILGSDYLVDLELSALQTEGRGEVVSNPRVITSNQKEATIEQGVEIPYQEASASGATSVSFKKAVLSLSVTPQITPDDRVAMDLEVNKDSVGGIFSGIPSIDTRSVTTQVLVNNGDTVVLGGIYEQSSANGESKVPLLGDIPLLGYLFRFKSSTENKSELLIFVTPKIIKESMNVGM